VLDRKSGRAFPLSRLRCGSVPVIAGVVPGRLLESREDDGEAPGESNLRPHDGQDPSLTGDDVDRVCPRPLVPSGQAQSVPGRATHPNPPHARNPLMGIRKRLRQVTARGLPFWAMVALGRAEEGS